jgi:acyl-CoA synthetase (AMP-forming)/AMP-acid ligase II
MTLTRSSWPADNSENVIATTVGDVLRAAAADAPELTALVAGRSDPAVRRSWTYAELLAEAERAARALLEIVSPGERIAVWAPNIPEWVILEFAAALAGVVLVSVSPTITGSELSHALGRSRTVALFYQEDPQDQEARVVLPWLRPRLPELRATIAFRRWPEFVGRADTGRPLPRVSPDAAAQVLFTSGTGGHPNGVVARHRAIANNGRFGLRRLGLGRGDVLLPAVPVDHAVGSALCVLGAVWHRATLVLPEPLTAGPLLELAETYRVQLLLTVPVRLAAMVEDPGAHQRDLRVLRTVVSATAPCPPELADAVESAFGCRVVALYGQTEACAIAAMDPADPADRADRAHQVPDAVGRALPGLECKITDLRTGEITGVGVPGELCVRGYQIMMGYLDEPAATARRIDPRGWLHTGDVASMDEHGRLMITARIRDVIMHNGTQIYPREIENRLYTHPEVGDAIVLGIPDRRWGQRVVAVIRPAAGSPPTPAELRAHCLGQLTPCQTPTEWYYVDSLPLSGPGKIKKYDLRERILTGRLKPATGDASPSRPDLSKH